MVNTEFIAPCQGRPILQNTRASLRNGTEQELRDNQKYTKEFIYSDTPHRNHLHSLWDMSETACPVPSKCYFGLSAEANVLPTQLPQESYCSRASNRPLKSKQPLHPALENFHCPLQGVMKRATSFFYDAPIPNTESYFNIMATPLWSPLWQICTNSSSKRKSAEMQPLHPQKWNEKIHLVISPISSERLSIRLKTLPLKPS